MGSSMFGLTPRSKQLNLIDKKVVFYPEMARVSKKDALLFEFLKKDFGCPFGGGEIDPGKMGHQNPDFGFNNHLIFDQ